MASKKRKDQRPPKSPLRESVDLRARIRPDLMSLIDAVGERRVKEMSELDVARMRRFALDRVYSGQWCRQRARLVWLALEDLVEEMAGTARRNCAHVCFRF